MHQDVITHGNILMNYTGKNFELYLPSRAQFVDLKKPWREPINQQQKIRPSERTNNHSYLPTTSICTLIFFPECTCREYENDWIILNGMERRVTQFIWSDF